jgi:hypothetical protein
VLTGLRAGQRVLLADPSVPLPTNTLTGLGRFGGGGFGGGGGGFGGGGPGGGGTGARNLGGTGRG